MKKPKAIQLYLDTADQFDALTDQQAGKVIKALLRFAHDDKEQQIEDDQAAQIMYIWLRAQIQRDFEKYRARCEANAHNGKKGGAPVGNKNAEKNKTAENGFDRLIKETFSDTYSKTTETSQEEKEEKQEEKYEEEDKEREKEEIKKEQPKNGCFSVLSLFRRICPAISVDTSDELISDDVVSRAEASLDGTSFERLFEKVQRSDFLSGRSGKWKGCTLRWILDPENIERILRGVYDNPRSSLSSFTSGVTTTIDYSKHKSLFDE